MFKKTSIKTITNKKLNNEKIISITAYDYTFARIIDQCNVDIILVGDSLSNVVAGYRTTLPITLDEMIYHCRSVRRGVNRSLLIGDMPFLSYQISTDKAIDNVGRMMKESQVEGVKLEGGELIADTVYRLTQIGIPVLGHIGFTPQSEHQLGGHIVQGRKNEQHEKLIKEAKILEQAGAFAIVLELIKSDVAKNITNSIKIPTIGIGAGVNCDGQIIVCYDVLGMTDFNPKFLRKYANLQKTITDAINCYAEDITLGKFPSSSESY